MHWPKLKKILRDHPYLLDDAFQMSITQAERIQEKEGYPSFEEMVMRAKQKSSAPASAWVTVDAVIARHKKARSPATLWNALFSRPVRGWVIACLCTVLLGCYLSLAPSGRALASYVARIVMYVLDTGFSFRATSGKGVLIQESDLVAIDAVEKLPDLQSVRLDVGSPILYLQNEMFNLDNVQLYNNELTGKHLLITYITASGQHVELQQRWNINSENWLQVYQDEKVWEESLPDGTILHCFIDPIDSTFNATAVWQDSILWIYADEGIIPQEVVRSIRTGE